jgi:hypothetical protein
MEGASEWLFLFFFSLFPAIIHHLLPSVSLSSDANEFVNSHMTCKKCKYEFCWVCMGPWSEHGTQWYSCNRYDEKAGVDARDAQSKSRASLERYLHVRFLTFSLLVIGVFYPLSLYFM